MSRQVVINLLTTTPTATPFETEAGARARLTSLLEAALGQEELQHTDLGTLSLDSLGELMSDLFTLDEGSEGVWTGYSSADRSAIGGQLPLDGDEWTGNGDAVVFRTAGVPAGMAVVGVEDPTLAGEEDEDDDEG